MYRPCETCIHYNRQTDRPRGFCAVPVPEWVEVENEQNKVKPCDGYDCECWAPNH